MNKHQETTAANAHWLLWAGFMAILAAGVGFAIRGGILLNWRTEFSFTQAELGVITGAGFTGFCFGIIIGGFVADIIGYGWLVAAAFAFHVISALVTLYANPEMSKDTAYNFLCWGTFIFALANGTLEAVANPLVATLFPNNRTHYLNILHASWPAGLILGGVAGAVLGEQLGWHWKSQLGLFLVPTVIYGLMFIGQKMPRSEASDKGLGLGQMLKDVGLMGGAVACFLLALFFKEQLKLVFGTETPMSHYLATGVAIGLAAVLWVGMALLTGFSLGAWLIFVLFITHAMVGAVELGTDSWIQNITGNILDPKTGKWLFVYTSAIMFLLRFCAHFIEKRLGLSPVGLLLVCAVLACVGLNLVSMADSTIPIMLALLVYGVGKTFFWPTMLAVASDRFPRTGALAISIMGGIGMMSAGLIGSPGLGYFKDRFAGESLTTANPALYEQFKAGKDSQFIGFPAARGLDGAKLGAINDVLKKAREEGVADPVSKLSDDQKTVLQADVQGDRRTLVADSAIPAAMAVVYLLLLLYFKAIGGYRIIHLDESKNVG